MRRETLYRDDYNALHMGSLHCVDRFCMARTVHHPSYRLLASLALILATVSLAPQAILPDGVRAAGVSTPLLLVTDGGNSADPFGPYLAEILRVEGFPTVATAD